MTSKEQCNDCGLPVVMVPSGSANGGSIRWGCARCNLLRAEKAEQRIAELEHKLNPDNREPPHCATCECGPEREKMLVAEQRIAKLEAEIAHIDAYWAQFDHYPKGEQKTPDTPAVKQCVPPCPVELCAEWSKQGMCMHAPPAVDVLQALRGLYSEIANRFGSDQDMSADLRRVMLPAREAIENARRTQHRS